jgi:hypothetical protein
MAMQFVNETGAGLDLGQLRSRMNRCLAAKSLPFIRGKRLDGSGVVAPGPEKLLNEGLLELCFWILQWRPG